MSNRNAHKLPAWLRLLFWGVVIPSFILLILYASLEIWLSTWRTYKNDVLGFSFRYPIGWYVDNYGFGPESGNFTQTHFSPKPQTYGNVVDFSKVSFQAQIDVYNKKDLNDQLFKYDYFKIGNGRFLILKSSSFSYIVMTKNRSYNISGSSEQIVGTSFLNRNLQFLEGILTALSLKY